MYVWNSGNTDLGDCGNEGIYGTLGIEVFERLWEVRYLREGSCLRDSGNEDIRGILGRKASEGFWVERH